MLKAKLVEHFVLAFQLFASRPYSKHRRFKMQIGCFLLQKQPYNRDKPIAYWSRSLHYAKRVYYRASRKFSAVFLPVLLLPHYRDGCRLTLCTSLQALRWTQNLTDSTEKLLLWPLRGSRYELDDVYGKAINIKQLTLYTNRRLPNPMPSQLRTEFRDSASPPPSHTKRWKVIGIYLQGYDECNKQNGTCVPHLYARATSTETNQWQMSDNCRKGDTRTGHELAPSSSIIYSQTTMMDV